MPLANMAQNSQRKEKKPVRVETITVNGWGLAMVMARIKGEFSLLLRALVTRIH